MSASSARSSPYPSRRLRPGEIRLLTIDWSSHSRAIHLTTQSLDLSITPYFDVMSYVWGNAPVSIEVICNKGQLRVSPSTNEMLTHLRLDRPNPDRPLWIDAICINQEDEIEKASQIRLMQRIYRRASQVIIWFGPSIPETRAFMTDFPRVAELAKIWRPKIWTHDKFWRGEKWPPDYDHFWSELFHLLNHDWFKRLWTFQEVVLANQAALLCGSHYVDVDDLFEFVDKGHYAHSSYVTYTSKEVACALGNTHLKDIAFAACRAVRHFRNQTVVPLSDSATRPHRETGPIIFSGLDMLNLPRLLHDLRSRYVQEPVDRVWAIVGLLNEELQGHLLPFIDHSDEGRTEYWKTHVRFAKISLNRPVITSKSLLLHENSASTDRSLLCSKTDEQEGQLDVSELMNHPSKFISTAENDNLLQISGFVVDVISEVVEHSRLLGAKSYWFAFNFDLVLNNPLHRVVLEVSNQALALARRIYGGTENDDTDIPPEFLVCLLMDDRCSSTMDVSYRNAMISLTGAPSYLDSLSEQRRSKAWDFGGQISKLAGHSFFSTTGGRFRTAHPGLKAGDKVGASYGGEPLYVLRWPNDSPTPFSEHGSGHAEFCCPAYIPHLMKQCERDAAKLSEDEIFVIA
ncbi:HET-domain-containing protein [Ophiobolus disseminans]|uniref:HET-domain-containing protein n=1 Tax=Ophiobolus disseminans TaxID=1469910 RepID=A0A6A6ZRG9_9PLEO|nr:HET-domain-containing protein [Ophiobolus disseminans]